jgi:tetratricopeptide (TPR) repeat protein
VKKLTAIVLAATVAVTVQAQTLMGGLSAVNAALQAGQADHALSLLAALPAADAGTAEAHNLRCRVYFTLEQWDAAVGECQQAVRLGGQNSIFHMWLGRALGESADRASFFTAYGMAKRARSEFEQAVALDPRNAAALADLGEFYSSAPGIVGGGTDKAQGVVSKLEQVDMARAHELRSRIAYQKKDFSTAEQELRQAIAVGSHPAFQWMGFASFLRRRERWDDMAAAVASGKAAAEKDPTAGVALFNGASVLLAAGRNLDLAAKLLDAYLAGPVKTEEAPAFSAHVMRARVAVKLGDTARAKQERDAALALASQYKPALDLKF